ncbi:MAG: hypothetical protein NWQ31_06465 [Polaribacter sp.]|nr:hypothetical protein [Polaribacter sp.]
MINVIEIIIKKKWSFFASFFILIILISACNYSANSENNLSDNQQVFKQRKIEIPKDTLNTDNDNFSIKNGTFYKNNVLFSGVLKKYYPHVKMTTYTSVFNGKNEGDYRSFYNDGQPYEIKEYKNNRVHGRHLMYWKNGKLKADYFYKEGKMEGNQKKWYKDGKPYSSFNYINGKREGKQNAWRDTGEMHINSEIVNGKTYGLNRAALCYYVKNDQPVRASYIKVDAQKKK